MFVGTSCVRNGHTIYEGVQAETNILSFMDNKFYCYTLFGFVCIGDSWAADPNTIYRRNLVL